MKIFIEDEGVRMDEHIERFSISEAFDLSGAPNLSEAHDLSKG
jgi:hypothetical protein